MVKSSSVDRNVEDVLMNTKVFRRKPGDVPYPVEHSGAFSLTCDLWDNLFLRTCLDQDVAMHRYEKPPTVVLDLGCGSGYWAIEAAKRWTNSTIVGYDVRDIQPRLFSLEPYKDIAHRVKWVHGNLLDGLPFSSSHFDFVRIFNIGLGVPEDEWQQVFEEVARVMKPGGVIEVIEEDHIFPCAHPAPRTRPRPSPISIDLPLLDSAPASTLSSKSVLTFMSDPWSTTLDERFELNSPKSTYTLNSFPPPTFPIRQMTLPETHPYSTFAPRERESSLSEPSTRVADPRDHSKLKAAWDAMLYSRFIASKPLSVLPFYLSASFVDVQANPPLKIVLPANSYPDGPNASTSQSSGDSSATLGHDNVYSINDSSSTSTRSSGSNSTSLSSTPSVEAQCRFSTFWSNMHLASTVHKVTGCKEAIWEEYKKLYNIDGPLVTRTARPDEARAMSTKSSSTREAFDEEWMSWQNDMTDRIGMRKSLVSEFGWPEPPGNRPNWRLWRSLVTAVQIGEENRNSFDASFDPGAPKDEDPDLCRCMRAWIGYKP